MQDLKYAVKSRNGGTLIDICKDLEDILIAIHKTVEKFRSAGRRQSSTFTFWDSFIEAGELLLRLLRAEIDADFELHLNAAAEVIPYFILAGRNKYSKYTPVYISEMWQLKEKQPDMYKHMEAGAFVVRRSEKVKFNSVSTDQALEQTINLKAKSKGGFTLRKSALLRWLLTRHITAEYNVAFKSMLSCEKEDQHHPEFGSSRTERDQSDVVKIRDGVLNQFENPFDLSTFNDLGEVVLRKLMKVLNDDTLGVSDVAVVFDRYDKENSIKSMERSRRGGSEIVSSHIISGNRVVPNYKQYLRLTGNKASISAFINKYVEENAPSRLTNSMSIVLSGGYADGGIAKQVTKRGSVLVNHLSCSQEEADTRMILHATNLCRESSRLIVRQGSSSS